MVTLPTRIPAFDAGSAERSQPDYAFDFCGGHLALDFANTVGDRGATPDEHLHTFGDVVAWAVARGVLTRTAAGRLARTAASRPRFARLEHARVIALREALYRAFASAASERSIARTDLERINREVARSFSRARVTIAGGRIMLSSAAGANGLDAVLDPVIRSAVDLLTSNRLARVRLCANRDCSWLFFDTTRNRARRWCDMRACGNRAKVRRYRQRSGGAENARARPLPPRRKREILSSSHTRTRS
jgi:predicted RNA-binding Zn ribbon-like protein